MLQEITVRVELGPYVLRGREVGHLEVQQAVGAHAHCTVAFTRDPAAVASPVATLRLAELAGAPLRVVFVADGGDECLAFAGWVRQAEIDHLATGAGEVTVRGLSDSYTLGEHTDRRYFRKQDAAALARGFDLKVLDGVAGGTVRDYVQAGVSAWAFLAQVTAEEGLQLRARWPRTPDGAADAPAEVGRGFADEAHPLTWGRELLRLTTALAPTNAGVTGAFYEPTSKHDHQFRGVRAQVAWLGGARPVVAAAREASTSDADGGDPGHLEPGRVSGVRARTLTEFRDRLELASARRLGSTVTARGMSVLPALRAGDRIEIAAAPELQSVGEDGAPSGELADRTGTFGLITVTHLWTGTLYENLFTATPWAEYHPEPATVAAPEGASSGGLMVGVVTEVHDPKGMGRVRVRLPWMEDGEYTAWVRVAGMGGGNGRGVAALPSQGDEVVIGAVDGDHEHLVMVGALWNAVDKAAHAPGRQHWVTPAGNTLSFSEGKAGADEEKVELHSKGGACMVQLAAKGPTGVPTVTVHSEGDLALEAPKGELRLTAKSMATFVETDAKREVKGAVHDKITGPLTIASQARLALKGGPEVVLLSDGTLRAHAKATQTLTGQLVTLNPNGAQPPQVEAQAPEKKASAWGARPVPGPGPGRSTKDPKTPTRKELAQKAQKASLAAEPAPAAAGAIDPRWTSLDDGEVVAPGPGGAAGAKPPVKLTPEQQKLHDIKALLNKSATGRAALKTLDDNKVPVGFKAGGGSYWNGKKIIIDQTQGTQDAALTLVHEANHARATLKGLSGNALTQTRAGYLKTMVNEEAVGTVRSIVAKRELVAAGVPITATFPLESQYTTAYNTAAGALAKVNPQASAAAQAIAGGKAGLTRVIQGFTKGEVVTSTNGQPYPTYYGSYWDALHPPKKTGP